MRVHSQITVAPEKYEGERGQEKFGKQPRPGPMGLEGCDPKYEFYWKCSRCHLMSDMIRFTLIKDSSGCFEEN